MVAAMSRWRITTNWLPTLTAVRRMSTRATVGLRPMSAKTAPGLTKTESTRARAPIFGLSTTLALTMRGGRAGGGGAARSAAVQDRRHGLFLATAASRRRWGVPQRTLDGRCQPSYLPSWDEAAGLDGPAAVKGLTTAVRTHL